MNILLVSPEFGNAEKSTKYSTRRGITSCSHTPQDLIVMSAMFPSDWNKKLVDLNYEKFNKKNIKWADYVFINAESSQAKSIDNIIDTCHLMHKRIVGSGSYFSLNYSNYNHIDHLLLNEVELTMPDFLIGFENNWPWRLYRANEFANLKLSPIPEYSLLDTKRYSEIKITYAKAFPDDSEYCALTNMRDRSSRIKNAGQIILELDSIYQTSYRGTVTIEIDNIEENSRALHKDLLPFLLQWNNIYNSPFSFKIENIAELGHDNELMSVLDYAGFIDLPVTDVKTETTVLKQKKKRRSFLPGKLVLEPYASNLY